MRLFREIREQAAEVSRRARQVRIDFDRADALAKEIARETPGESNLDPGTDRLDDPDTTLAFVVTLDAINFGSGWFPFLDKVPGRSGYRTIAARLRARVQSRGAWSAGELGRLSVSECAETLGQADALDRPEVAELMGLYTQALRDLGNWLDGRFGGSFADAIEAAEGRAERLVGLLAEMPFYRDVSSYEGREVPFYKRAQITAADLHRALGGAGLGCFEDLDQLTLFADNLVPHVLRQGGVLVYESALGIRIDAGELLQPGSPEEVEIRATALHAVESMAEGLSAEGIRFPARELDTCLWSRGQRPAAKAQPRHRARCVYY